MSDRQVPVHAGLFEAEGDGTVTLLGSRCGSCGRACFPRAAVCPYCASTDLEPVRLSPTGTLWGWTTVRAAPPGYEGPVPYGFGIVSLPADGLQVVTRLVETDPSALHEGDAMRFTVVPLTPGTVTWAFARA